MGLCPLWLPRTMAMTRSSGFKVGMGIAVAALAGSQVAAQAPTLSVDPSRLPRLGTIDARFQSYKLEMVEVTGGRFWKPYRASASAPSASGADNSGNVPRRAAIPTSTRIWSRSTYRIPDCVHWLRRWPQPTCASAAPQHRLLC
jgi:hypothetical protein